MTTKSAKPISGAKHRRTEVDDSSDLTSKKARIAELTSLHKKSNPSKINEWIKSKTAVEKRISELKDSMLGTYVNTRSNVDIKCHICQKVRRINARVLIKGGGCCEYCVHAKEDAEFHQRVSDFGGSVLGDYKSVTAKTKCKCAEGHERLISLQLLRIGRQLCKICSGRDQETAKQNFYRDIEEMEATLIGKYVKANVPVKLKCKRGHECSVRPNAVQKGQGICRICAGLDIASGETKFRENIAKMGGTITGPYVNSKTRVDCLCPKGHPCTPLPNSINSGFGMCQKCNYSHGERRIDELLKDLEVKYEPQFRFGTNLRKYDFRVDKTLIEFDGIGHFEVFGHFGGDEGFQTRTRRDIEKTKDALDKQYRLIRLHFSWLNNSKETQIKFLKESLNDSTHSLIVFGSQHYPWIDQFNSPSSLFVSTQSS